MRGRRRSDTDDRTNGFGPHCAPIANAATARARQVLLVPGAAAPLLALDLPNKLRGFAREQVARRQMQDRLGLDPDAVEMRPFQETSKSLWHRILVADPKLVRGWRAQITRGQKTLLPDYLALPTAHGLWTICSTNDGLAVRLGPENGFGASPDVAQMILSKHLADPRQRPAAILMLGEMWDGLAALADPHGVRVVTQPSDLREIEGVGNPVALQHGELSCNLLRDPELIRDRLREQLMPLRLPAAILCVALGLWVASDVMEIRRLQDERIAIQTAAEEVVRDVFVPRGPILDMREQVLQAEAAMRSRSAPDTQTQDALGVFERIGPALFQANARILQVASPDGVRLDLLVETPDFAAADALSLDLADYGITVRVIASRRTDDGAAARSELQLTATNPEAQP